MSKIEQTAKPLGFNVNKKNYKVFMSFFFISRLIFSIVLMAMSTPFVRCNGISLIYTRWDNIVFIVDSFLFDLSQMKLQGDKTGRKGQLSVATEVMT